MAIAKKDILSYDYKQKLFNDCSEKFQHLKREREVETEVNAFA
jgi:hypothetical protein